jgi:hypothetical protein
MRRPRRASASIHDRCRPSDSRATAIALCAFAVLLPAEGISALDAAKPGHESRFVQVRGIGMHYLDFGGSGLPVIFLHGGHGDARNFVDFAPRFADGFRILAPNRRGRGESENVDWGYGTAAQAEDILGSWTPSSWSAPR